MVQPSWLGIAGPPRQYRGPVVEASAASGTLIRTKVHAPIARAIWLPRPEHLVERLVHGPPPPVHSRSRSGRMGKSSLLDALVGRRSSDPRPFAWLALDRGDNDPVRFFLYAIEALRTLADYRRAIASILRTPGWTSSITCCRP